MTFTPEQEQYMQRQMVRAYHEGLQEGIKKYAHWRDGVQYVGTTGCTLQQAFESVNQEEADILARYERMKQL